MKIDTFSSFLWGAYIGIFIGVVLTYRFHERLRLLRQGFKMAKFLNQDVTITLTSNERFKVKGIVFVYPNEAISYLKARRKAAQLDKTKPMLAKEFDE